MSFSLTGDIIYTLASINDHIVVIFSPGRWCLDWKRLLFCVNNWEWWIHV